jgi:hypothetical protein
VNDFVSILAANAQQIEELRAELAATQDRLEQVRPLVTDSHARDAQLLYGVNAVTKLARSVRLALGETS